MGLGWGDPAYAQDVYIHNLTDIEVFVDAEAGVIAEKNISKKIGPGETATSGCLMFTRDKTQTVKAYDEYGAIIFCATHNCSVQDAGKVAIQVNIVKGHMDSSNNCINE